MQPTLTISQVLVPSELFQGPGTGECERPLAKEFPFPSHGNVLPIASNLE